MYQSPFPQSPFLRPTEPPPMPTVLKPLVYCGFRVASAMEYGDHKSEVTQCAVFASEIIQEMAFCYQHGLIIQNALEAEQSGREES